jgi:pimeloyl-ACP methyl ester carboxylesterase
LLFAKGAQYALDLTFKDCDADPTCHQAFPKLREEFQALLARFNSGDQEIKIVNPADNKPQIVKLTRANFTERLRLLLYTTTFARFVPLIIHYAYENDFLPFESVTTSYNPGAILARGLYLTVTCSEGIPFISEDDLKRESAGTFVGMERVRVHQQACALWSKGDVPQNFIDPVKSDLPVLMISGELDASTPPWWAESALKYLPNGRQVKIRYYGHQVDDPCVWNILNQFVEAGSAAKLDTSCADNIKRPPFATKVVQSPPQ